MLVTIIIRSPPEAIPPSQPVAPEIFFGRDDIVFDCASLIARNEQTKVAILGTGGIGKTSTALHILHHQDVVDRYDNRRYFVGCDAATSAESLATLILQIIQVPSVAGENILTVLLDRALHTRGAAHASAARQLRNRVGYKLWKGHSCRFTPEDWQCQAHFTHDHDTRHRTTGGYYLDTF